MSRIINEITGEFEIEKIRNKRRIIVFLICLLISTALWFMNALNKDYITTVSYPVKFTNPPDDLFLSGNYLKEMNFTVKGKGFLLLQHKLLSFSPVVFDIEEITHNLIPVEGTYRVVSRNLLGTISQQISSDLSVSDIKPEIIEIVLDKLSKKTVPVELEISVEFAPQMNLKNPVTTNPDKVEITGPAILLEKTDAVKTKVNIANKLSTGITQEIELIPPDKTTISPSKVVLNIEVEKYTEKEIRVPVEIINKPENVKMKIFPSDIKILFSVGLSRFESIKPSDFAASVDYNSVASNLNNLEINLYKKPPFIQAVRVVPERVEFLVEKTEK